DCQWNAVRHGQQPGALLFTERAAVPLSLVFRKLRCVPGREPREPQDVRHIKPFTGGDNRLRRSGQFAQKRPDAAIGNALEIIDDEQASLALQNVSDYVCLVRGRRIGDALLLKHGGQPRIDVLECANAHTASRSKFPPIWGKHLLFGRRPNNAVKALLLVKRVKPLNQVERNRLSESALADSSD